MVTSSAGCLTYVHQEVRKSTVGAMAKELARGIRCSFS